MTPVGSGLIDAERLTLPGHFMAEPTKANGSIWSTKRGTLYKDQKASNVGDLLTVNISINDRAVIGNSTDRSRESQIKGGLNYNARLFGTQALGAAAADMGSSSSTKGDGAINRSERIQLSIAAVVVRKLPNQTLIILGSQEIRVNYELRILQIAGIVRPQDITRENTLSYDKIAEARVSYGGRGRLMEVQQPNTIQQIYDLMKPL